MHPELFRIGNFPVQSFGVVLVIGFIVGLVMAGKRAARFGLKPEVVQDVAIWMIFAGVAGARIAYLLLNWKYYAQHPNELWTLRFQGLTSFGGLIGGALAILLLARKHQFKPLDYMDTVALPVLIGHAIGRIGCFLNGCCYGSACSTSPPGVHFVGLPGLHTPAQLYDTVMTLIGAGLLVLLEKKRMGRGGSAGWMMIIYGVSRFIYEFWRDGYTAEKLASLPITQAQAASLILVVVGVALLIRSRKLMQEPLPA